MHGSHLKGKTAIVGSGAVISRMTDERRRTPLELHARAAHLALADAGITRKQVGALLTGRAPRSYDVRQFNMRLLNELKIAPTYTTEITAHGAGPIGAIEVASMMVASGTVDYVLCTSGNNNSQWTNQVKESAIREADPQFEAFYGPTTPALYAQVAQRYMYETGATSAQFAKAAVECRKWALHHPEAAMRSRGEISIEDVLNSRLIASPLHLLDCAPWFPGGNVGALVITRSDLAEKLRPDPAYILGYGQCTTHEWITDRLGLWGVEPAENGPNLTQMGSVVAAKQAYAMSGLTPKDIDLAQSTVPFSFLIPMMLEQLGFCPTGQGGAFVGAGGMDCNGGFPFNTSGGYLSYGQSTAGLYMVQECMEQIQGKAKGKQVPNAKRALVHGHGGPLGCHSVMILGSSPN